MSGIQSDTVNVQRAQDAFCTTCKAISTFNIVARYYYLEVYFFGLTFAVRYFVLCDVCGGGWELNTQAVWELKREGRLASPYIPMFSRIGLLFPIAAVGVFISFAALGLLATVAIIVGVVALFILPGEIKEVRRKGLRQHLRDSIKAIGERPQTLLGSAERTHKKCTECGLNNLPASIVCERCSARL